MAEALGYNQYMGYRVRMEHLAEGTSLRYHLADVEGPEYDSVAAPIYTEYHHLLQDGRASGWVNRQGTIGQCDNTGDSSGSHLHFSVKVGGAAPANNINPDPSVTRSWFYHTNPQYVTMGAACHPGW